MVLAILAIVLYTSNRYTTLKDYETDFSVRDTASVTRIFIADKNVNAVEIKRTDRGWILNDTYLANTRQIDLLLANI